MRELLIEKYVDKTILVVEDEDEVRGFLVKTLSRICPNVLDAANGQKGLEVFCQASPDIVITDITMPIMNGLAMAEKIRQENPEARIIVYSAHTDKENKERALTIGISKYLTKPYERTALFETLLELV